MLLYLIRHAEAADSIPDHTRPLTVRGRDDVARLAAFLRQTDAFCPAEVRHSPLVRARETAELLVEKLGARLPVRAFAGLTPDDDPRAIAGKLAGLSRSVALVGHEPHLSSLASLLVSGAMQTVMFATKKGAILALERSGGTRWIVRWHLEPGLLP